RATSFVVLVACAVLAMPVAAHEIGQTRVSVEIARDGAYQIEVVVDPDTLLPKLEACGATVARPPPDAMERDRRLAGLAPARLGLTMYGMVSLPSRIVEPMIAVSIAYVAVENLLTSEVKKWRIALVFAFGLLHGMGFAGVLKELGLPRSEFLTGLLTFNLGVEA